MNANKETKILSILALILAIAVAPISTAAFAQQDNTANVESDESTGNEVTVDIEVDGTEDDSNTTDETTRKEELKEKMEDLREKRAEKIEEFKDKVKNTYQDRLRTDVNLDRKPYDVSPDRLPDLTFSGDASGWTVIGSHAWKSSTTLNGEAWHIRGDIWKVHSKGNLTVADRTVDVELKGFAHGHRLTLHGTGYIGEDPIRVFIRGHYAPTVDYGVFAIAFTQMGVQNQNTGAKFTMAQVGSVIVTPTGDVAIPEPLPYDIPVDLLQ
jgi:hypothetical protein